MRTWNVLIVALVLSLVAGGTVFGTDLFTPPLPATSIADDNFGECVVTNVSEVTRDVLVEGFNSEGISVAVQTFTLDSFVTRGFSLSESNATGPVVFCKFSFKGNSSNFRAAIHVLDGGGDGIIAALEAH